MTSPRHACLLLLAGFVSLLAGCSSPSSPNAIMDRVDANRNEYETWPFEVKEAVLSGEVLRGMDTAMVLVARGKPFERVDRGNGDEVWVYRIRSENSSGGSILPRGTQISLGGGSPSYPGGNYPGSASYPGSTYPGGTYPGSTYPGGGSGVYIPPIVLGGGGNEIPEDEEEIFFHNGRVTHGDGVKK